MNLKNHIRTIPDFPKKGIVFYDISTLLGHAEAWRTTIDHMADEVARFEPQMLVGIESRGFIFAAPLALKLGLGFAMVRKQGKLPGSVVAHSYDLEYGTDTVEVSADLIAPGSRIVVIDDLIATGGTARASIELLRKIGARVEAAVFMSELRSLQGRRHLDVPVVSLLTFD